MSGLLRRRLPSGETLRLLPILGPVALGGLLAVAACLHLAFDAPPATLFAGTAVLAAAAIAAEAFPVPVPSFPAGTISLSAIFIVAAGVLYGWAPAVAVGVLARGVVEVIQRRPAIKLVFNSSLYALSGLAAGIGAELGGRPAGIGGLFGAALAGSAAFCLVNVCLVVAIVARASNGAYVPMLRRWFGWTAVSFGVMASVSLMLSGLWERSPWLAVGLVGPLAATALYQRSLQQTLDAMRLALTDPLTGLGNHRHFHDQLARELEAAEAGGHQLGLCLFDLDDFKRINDTYGHPAGDEVLAAVAGCLRSGGEAYRFGGDEFALILPRHGEADAGAVAFKVLERLTAIECRGEAVTFSAGLAVYPRHAHERTELLRVADDSLYEAKREGKNRLRVAGADALGAAAVA